MSVDSHQGAGEWRGAVQSQGSWGGEETRPCVAPPWPQPPASSSWSPSFPDPPPALCPHHPDCSLATGSSPTSQVSLPVTVLLPPDPQSEVQGCAVPTSFPHPAHMATFSGSALASLHIDSGSLPTLSGHCGRGQGRARAVCPRAWPLPPTPHMEPKQALRMACSQGRAG